MFVRQQLFELNKPDIMKIEKADNKEILNCGCRDEIKKASRRNE